jgi:hypothetical protein
MRLFLSRLLLLLTPIAACSHRGEAARNPGSPTPVAEPGPGPGAAGAPRGRPGSEGTAGLPEARRVPVRPDQAPLVHIREALEADTLLGRRVRIAGRCAAAGAGPRAGSWTLEQDGATIEVRGLVPSSCGTRSEEHLTIFAQIEPKTAGSPDRLLLRLPD